MNNLRTIFNNFYGRSKASKLYILFFIYNLHYLALSLLILPVFNALLNGTKYPDKYTAIIERLEKSVFLNYSGYVLPILMGIIFILGIICLRRYWKTPSTSIKLTNYFLGFLIAADLFGVLIFVFYPGYTELFGYVFYDQLYTGTTRQKLLSPETIGSIIRVIVIICSILAVIFTLFVGYLIRKNKDKVFASASSTSENKAGPQGIRGWLFYIVFCLIVGNILYILSSLGILISLFTGYTSYIHPHISLNNPSHLPFIIFEVISTLGLAVLLFYATRLFFKKKRDFIFFYSLFLSIGYLLVFVNLGAAAIFGPYKDVLNNTGDLVSFLILSYIVTSRRVENTFIN